jgi:hypothetical protein
LLSVSKHNIGSFYGWVGRRLSVNTIDGRIVIGIVVVFIRQ